MVCKFDFEVKHIKGKSNLLPDLLSKTPPSIQTQIPTICMFKLFSQNSQNPPIQNFPLELQNLIRNCPIYYRSKEIMLQYQSLVIKLYGIQIFGGLGFHLDYPFFNLFCINPSRIKKKKLQFALMHP